MVNCRNTYKATNPNLDEMNHTTGSTAEADGMTAVTRPSQITDSLSSQTIGMNPKEIDPQRKRPKRLKLTTSSMNRIRRHIPPGEPTL